MISPLRVEQLNDAPIREDGAFVVYWMTAFRRRRYNQALEKALELAESLRRPLLILEALRADYPWACDRFHAFVLQGMADSARSFDTTAALYYPFVETAEHSGKGLLKALSKEACAVVTDDYPAFFLPRMRKAAAEILDVPLIAVDSNGLIPLRAPGKLFHRAYDFRRWIHSRAEKIAAAPRKDDPFQGVEIPAMESLPEAIQAAYPRATDALLQATPEALADLPIDHSVAPSPRFHGGEAEALRRLHEFLDGGLDAYNDKRNKPGEDATSHLSPYLHFGHLSAAEIFTVLGRQEGFDPDQLNQDYHGKNRGFWGMSDSAEAFLDQFLTWRELGFNRCFQDPEGYEDYETLPDWAQTTLAEHADDERPSVYSLEEFDAAETHDELWNAAQQELRTTGVMHNYLRMLWGKKILHWSKSPRDALAIMIELNNKYALDGRDPNSYSGIFWVLGRFDRAWGPEREVFGKIRYMTVKSTRRKFNVDSYIQTYGVTQEV